MVMNSDWADLVKWISRNVFNTGVITLVLGLVLASLQGTAGLILMCLLVVALKRVIDRERAEAFSEGATLEEFRTLRHRASIQQKDGADHYWSAPN
jgi:hypothetical protein